MTRSNQKTKIVKDERGNGLAMMRVDKTLKEMMEERPAGRFDVEHWHPKFDKVLLELKKSKFKIDRFGNYIIQITTNNHVKKTFLTRGVQYYQTETVQNTGLLHYLAKFVEENGPNDPKRTRLQTRDILLIRSGTGSVGRVFTVVGDLGKANIVESVYLTRVRGVNPFAISVYFLTKYGQAEIFKASNGVSGIININRSEIEEMLIPILGESIERNIEKKYLVMSESHSKAMEAKKNGDEKEYKKNLEIAERMLRDLIVKTEAVIRGERKDVV